MHIFSDRIERIQVSPTAKISDRARQLKAMGVDIISLSQGESDFETPSSIKKAARRAIDEGFTRYTQIDGVPELKEAVCAKFRDENNISYQMSEITVTSGCKQLLFNALMTLVNNGDEVIIPSPYWVSYVAMVEIADGSPVVIPCKSANNFKLTPEQLDASITPKTRCLILNSPSNPSGAVYSRSELSALAEVLLEHQQVIIIADDIYEHLVYGKAEFSTIAEVEPQLKSRTLTCNGMSKAYSMTGWRIGFAGGPEPLIQAINKLQSQSNFHPASISQYAAIAGLSGDKHFLKERRSAYQERRDTLVRELNHIYGIECSIPDGAFYVFPSCADLLGHLTPDGDTLKTDSDIVKFFLDTAGVALVPGEAFGYPGYFRASYATDIDTLLRACERLRTASEKLISV
ncbi:MAG: aspartate aminotransferase [Acidiferrobacteraceae bacterium]|nr:aspartate aminotransferase [Acidiferrobacteraceae bacterium]